jgi:hypothetical protein
LTRIEQYGKKLDMKGRYTAAHAAYVLREFLTELPEPVIPFAQYIQFTTILGMLPVIASSPMHQMKLMQMMLPPGKRPFNA